MILITSTCTCTSTFDFFSITGDVKQSLCNSKLVEKIGYLGVTELFNDDEISISQTVPKVRNFGSLSICN